MKKLTKNLIFVLLIFILDINIFANTYENPAVLIGPNSSRANDVIVDENNHTLFEMMKIMTKEDNLKAIVLVSEYRKGNKDSEEALIKLISKYNIKDAKAIAEYMLRDNETKILSTYIVDHKTNTVQYVQIEGIIPAASIDALFLGNLLWQKIMEYTPEDFYKNIDFLYLEQNKPNENKITICDYGDDASKWCVYIDIALLFDENYDELVENMIYSTVYYYILRTDQIDKTNNKDNYSYRKFYYKEDSYINQFYKKFWKGRIKEINLGQYKNYPNDFINTKASKTVYDDMAVSFRDYLYHGVNRKNTTKPKELKRNFFDQFDDFKALANFYRIKLKIIPK